MIALLASLYVVGAVIGAALPSPPLSGAARDLLAWWAAVDASRAASYRPAAPSRPVRRLAPCDALTDVPEPRAALRAGTLAPRAVVVDGAAWSVGAVYQRDGAAWAYLRRGAARRRAPLATLTGQDGARYSGAVLR